MNALNRKIHKFPVNLQAASPGQSMALQESRPLLAF
jgi:hypothetical protein